jgi:hypothetical protein
MIGNDGRRYETGEFEPAVPVRRAHHGNLDMLTAESSDTPSPFTFDRRSPFELEAQFAKEINGPAEVFNDDPYIVHPLDGHGSNLPGFARASNACFERPAILARFAVVPTTEA